MAGHQFSRTPVVVPTLETHFRTIKTPLPAPGTQEILDSLDKIESRSMHGQIPLVWEHAKNFNVFDHAGNKWIDFTSTIFVANIGHANEHLKARLKAVLDHDLLNTYAYPNRIRQEYLSKLIAATPKNFEKAFLLSAGTEATEAALKLMRMNGQAEGKRRLGIVCVEGNWHGRTMGAQLMSSNVQQKAWIGHEDPDIHHIKFPYPWALNGASGAAFFAEQLKSLEQKGLDLSQDICGVMLETFQGWGAVFYPEDFVQAFAQAAQKYGWLLAFDEMQAGFARTGKLFGYEHYGVEPDLICCGKGIGSGFPISAVLGRAKIMDLPDIGNMSSTHSANPMACAAGLATLEEIESKKLVSETARKGEILFGGLKALQKKFPNRISHVFGRGLIAALIIKSPKTGEPDGAFTSLVAQRCFHKGLLVVHTGRESLKLGPPLTITDEALLEAISVIDEAFYEISAETSE